MNNTQNIVSTTIKGMVKQRAHPTSVKLTAKERKVLLENGIDARAFVGNRKQKVIYLNEQVALHMRPALTNAQRQKNFRDKFKATWGGLDYYDMRKEFKSKTDNTDKKFTKIEAIKLAKTKVTTTKRYVGTVSIDWTIYKKDVHKHLHKKYDEKDIGKEIRNEKRNAPIEYEGK